MKTRRTGFALALFAGALTLAAAGPDFSGIWKLNLAKSQLSGQTVSISKNASGNYHFEGSGYNYDFDLTGKEYPTPDGGTMAYRLIDPSTWEATSRMNGKVMLTYRLSLKGNTLTAVMKVPKPDGTMIEQTTVTTREGGGQGFLGKWKSTETKGAATTLEVKTDNTSHITVKYPEFQQTCDAAFDGKDYVVKAANGDSKQTFAFQKTGASTFRMTTKLNGRPFYIDTFTLSNDGMTLTDDGNAISANEPIKAIFEKQ